MLNEHLKYFLKFLWINFSNFWQKMFEMIDEFYGVKQTWTDREGGLGEVELLQ